MMGQFLNQKESTNLTEEYSLRKGILNRGILNYLTLINNYCSFDHYRSKHDFF